MKILSLGVCLTFSLTIKFDPYEYFFTLTINQPVPVDSLLTLNVPIPAKKEKST